MNSIHRVILIAGCFLLSVSPIWTQCPAITDSDLDQTDLNFCLGDVLTFTVEGTDLPAGDVIDWYISQTTGFNPYNSQGTSIGTTPIYQEQCSNEPAILYLMVNPDNAQVGSSDDRCDEFIIIYTGSGGYTSNDITVSNLAGGVDVTWDDFIPGNTATFNCGVALNPADPVPPNSILIIQANFTNNVTVDLGALCTSGLSVYIIAFNTSPVCTGGYLDNNTSGGCASCPVMLDINGTCMYSTEFNYTPPASSIDGWGFSNLGGGGVYADVVPAVSIPTFVTPDALVDPFVWNIPADFCSVFGSGTYFITGILNPAPSGMCMDIFTDEFQAHISCPSATLSGDISVCSSNCPDDPGKVIFDFSGGIEPYTVNLLVTTSGFPPFSIPGAAFDGSGEINICIGGVLPSYNPGTETLTIPEFLIGQQVTITLQSIVDDEGCMGVVTPPGTLVITLYDSPIANAGSDITACIGNQTQLNGSIGGSAQTFEWVTSGDGQIGDPTSLQSLYIPGANDLANGVMTITLIAFEPNDNCEPDSSTVEITFLEPVSALIGDTAIVCNDSTLGSVIDLFSFVVGGDTSGTWLNLGPAPIDISDPGNVDFNALPPSSFAFQYTSGSNPPCGPAIDTLTVQVLACICPELVVNPLPAALCNATSGVNLDAFVIASQPGTWTLQAIPPGIMPATLTGSFLNTNGVDAGVYEVMFSFNTHVDACPDSVVIEIVVQEAPVVLAGSDTLICNNDMLPLEGSMNSGVSFVQWTSSGDGTFGNSTIAGTSYTPGVMDIINGSVQLTFTGGDTSGICPISQSSLIMTIQEEPFTIFDTTFVSVCNIPDSGSVVNFVALITSGDASGAWIDIDASGADLSDVTEVDFNGIAAGIYQFQYTTMSAVAPCTEATYTISVEVEECMCPDLSVSNAFAVVCNNDSVDLNTILTTPQNGLWQLDNINNYPSPPVIGNGVLNATGATGGTYWLAFNLVDPVPGCLSTAGFSFNVEAFPVFSIADLSCRIANAVYDVTLVTDADTILSNFGTVILGNGDTVFIEDVPFDQDISVTLSSPLGWCAFGTAIIAPVCDCTIEISNVPDTVSFCEGDSIQVLAEVEGTGIEMAYWLTPGDTIFTPGIVIRAAGIYEYFVESGNGCTAKAELLAVEFSTLIPDIESFDPLCPGGTEGSIFIQDVSGATLPLMYSVNGGIFEVIDTTIWAITTLGAGEYFLVIEDAKGCQATASITLDDALGEILDLGPDLNIDSGDSILIDPEISFIPDAFTYMPALLDSLIGWIAPTQGIVLMIEATNSRGCTYHDEIQITVNQRHEMFTPNIFSPNGDQINDTWTIYAADTHARIRMLNIYDRWGGTLFSRTDIPVNDPSMGWDGTRNGKEAPPGVYVFVAIIDLSNGGQMTLGGEITVIR